MNEQEHSLTSQLLEALAANTQAQTLVSQAIAAQTEAIADLINIMSESDDDDEDDDAGSYLSGAPR